MQQTANYKTSKWQIVIGFISQNRLLFAITLLASLINNFINVLIPLSIGWFYDIVLHDSGSKLQLLNYLPIQIKSVNSFFTVFVILALIKATAAYFDKFLVVILGERFSQKLRDLTFEYQLKHTMQSHNVKPVGKYLLRYSGDLLAVQNLISKGILIFISDLFFILIAFTCLFFISGKLAVPVIISFFVIAILQFIVSRFLRNAAWNRRSQRSLNLGWLSSRLHAFYTIKSFNRETPELNSYLNRSKKLYKLGVAFARFSSLVQALPQVYFVLTLGLVLYISSVIQKGSGGISNGQIFSFILLLLYIQTVLKRLLKVTTVWQVGIVSFDKLLSIFNLPAEKRDKEKSIEEIKGKIQFNNVGFSYAGNTIIKDLSFQVLPNSINVISGLRGSGKTTVLKLIQKIYTPDSGTILLDDHSYSDLSAFSIRKDVTIVSPEAPLLGGTVFKAISYNTADEKKDKVIAMLNKLKLSFGDSDDANLYYKLDDGGKNLSVNQRLMLQFARAFLTRKKIILIEDVLFNLDEENREIIVNQLNNLSAKRTIILILNNPIQSLKINQIIKL